MNYKRKTRLATLRDNRIHKGKKWWKHLSEKDKTAFIQGFIKNKNAEKIQKEEIEFNCQKMINKELLKVKKGDEN